MHVKLGRRTSLTPELADRFLGLIRKGNHIETACKIVGITKQTLYNWLERARKSDGEEEPYGSFAEKFFQADGEAESNCMAVIDTASKDQWQAAAWKMERRWPDRWARSDRNKLEVTGQDGAAIKVTMDDIATAMSAITKNAVDSPAEPRDELERESGSVLGTGSESD